MFKNDTKEYIYVKQPASLALYIEKLKNMDEKTVVKYNKRWNVFLGTIKKNNEGLALGLDRLINEIIQRGTNREIKATTFRSYKAAACFGLAAMSILLKKDKIDYQDIEDGLNEHLLNKLYLKISETFVKEDASEELEKKTSSLKLKNFPKEFYDFLLTRNPSKKKGVHQPLGLLIRFVRANLIVGLRPIEWLDVAICSNRLNQEMVLVVKNAKNSQGRANGEFRELELVGATDVQKLSILGFYVAFHNKLKTEVDDFNRLQEKFKKSIKFGEMKVENPLNYIVDGFEPTIYKGMPKFNFVGKDGLAKNGLAEKIQSAMQTAMYREFNFFCDDLNGNPYQDLRVTLYSTRHQCIANAKASKVNIFEIAAFFGHSSKETSSRHYGKAWHGWSSFQFKPSLESIRHVNGSEEYLLSEYGYPAVDAQLDSGSYNLIDDLDFDLGGS